MSEMQDKLKKIVSNVEKNLKNKEDLEYVKTQIYSIYAIFMDEFDRLEEKSSQNMDSLLIKYKILEDRMKEIENSIDRIQSDIYINEDEDYAFDITCPYCDTEFSVDCSEKLKNNVVCPECNNTIELDWNDHDGCSHDCHCCDGSCGEDHQDENDDDM